MRKSDIKDIVEKAINPRGLCQVLMKYNTYYELGFPIAVSDKLFLVANEHDFILDGFTINRFRDVKEAQIVEDKYLEIAKGEGLVDSIEIPDINISDWYSVFVSLQKRDKNIIVENEYDEDSFFAIGRINKVTKTKVYLEHFDADGIWEKELWGIPFTQITSVSFGTRYVEIFSKYISQP